MEMESGVLPLGPPLWESLLVALPAPPPTAFLEASFNLLACAFSLAFCLAADAFEATSRLAALLSDAPGGDRTAVAPAVKLGFEGEPPLSPSQVVVDPCPSSWRRPNRHST